MNNPKLDFIRERAESLSKEEKLELALYLLADAKGAQYDVKTTDLTKFYGTIHFQADAMEYQQQARSEWDR